MKRVSALVLLLVAPGCHDQVPARTEPRPNVLLIVVDTLRADRLGSYRNRRQLTPFLDELAAHATVFHRAYATSSWTRPSVASLFTSRVPSRHGAALMVNSLAAQHRTLPEMLHAYGYDTAGWSANPMISAAFGFARGFDLLDDPEAHLIANQADTPLPARAAELDRSALTWAAMRRKAPAPPPPGFLYLHYMDVHWPYAPKTATLVTMAQRLPDMGTVNGTFVYTSAKTRPTVARDLVDAYDASLQDLDAQLRTLFTSLRSSGFLERALVVVTADHGEEFLDHGEFSHGRTLYEEVLRVPLVVQLPGQTAHHDVHEVVSLIDVAPTILAVLGVAPPPSFEGRSFAELLDEPTRWTRVTRWLAPSQPRIAFSELLPKSPTDEPTHDRALVVGIDKLLVRRDGTVERYDLARDPKEAAPATEPAAIDALARRLEQVTRGARDAPAPILADAIDETKKAQLKALGYAVD